MKTIISTCTFIFILLFFISTGLCQDTSPPILVKTIADQTINEDQHFRLELKLGEVFSDESPLSFSINKNNADWLTNVGDSILLGFPLQEHVGEYTININATDESGNSSSTSFTINVVFVDDKPIVIKNLPGQLQRPGFGEIKIGYKETFYDEEDNELSYKVHSSYTAVATAELVGDSIFITEKGIGPAEIILTATDSHGNETEARMFIRIFEEAEILNMTTANTGSNNLANSRVTCIYEDSSDNLWLGFDDIISMYRKGKQENTNYILESTGDNDILEIYDADNGNTFFISQHYLCKYNLENFSILNQWDYDIPFGVQASYISKDSILYLAGGDHTNKTDFRVSKYDDNKWVIIFHEDDIDQMPLVNNMCVDGQNNIWLATENGLILINNGVNNYFTELSRTNGTNVSDVDVDIYGNIWIVTDEAVYKYNHETNREESFQLLKTTCLFCDNIGYTWIGTRNGTVHRVKDNKLESFYLKDPIPGQHIYLQNSVNRIHKTKDGRYWFCCEYCLYISENYLLKDESTIIQNSFDGLPSNNITDIKKDQDGMYWVNTSSGLSTYDGSSWNFFGAEDVIHDIDSKNRKLGVYDWSNLVIIERGGSKKTFSSDLTGIGRIHDVIAGSNDNIWIGGSYEGLTKFDGTNWIYYTTDDGLLFETVDKIFPASNSSIWIAYDDESISEADFTLSKFDGNSFSHFGKIDGFSGTYIKSFLEDKNGNIWIGTLNGLFKYDGNMWTRYSHEESGLKSNFIMSLSLDFEGGIWITYFWIHGLGVSRFDGTKFDHFTTADGLPTNKIKNIYVDHALTNQNKSASIDDVENAGLIWLGSQDKGAANFYLQNATFVVDRSLPKMQAMLFPNPTQGITNILLDNQSRKYLEIEILAIDGTKVHTERRTDLYGKIRLNLSELSSGTYFVRLKSNIDSTVKKVILK